MFVLVAAAFAGAFAPHAGAGQLAEPSGDVLLSVTGGISNTNIGSEARFDRGMLSALGVARVVTATPWHKPGTVFEGIVAERLMEAVGAQGDTIMATAANDYRVRIPLSDFAEHGVLLAMRIDGQDLELRTKGPLWLIYPETSNMPESDRAERMIWQVVEMHVE